jgi:purine-nucleoside phosphorylase
VINSSSLSLGKILVDKKLPAPSLHVVLGSGLAPAFSNLGQPKGFELAEDIPFGQIPGLLPSTAPGHKGTLRFFRHLATGRLVVFQVGRLHGYEGHSPQDVVAPLVQSALAGTPRFLLTNAAGSLDPSFHPGSLMVIRDHVNFTGKNPLYGINPADESGKTYGPRFTDMSQAYNVAMSDKLWAFLSAQGFVVHEGKYLGVNGPTFETPAEVKLFSSWGMGSVGMSTVWETMALNYLGKQVAGLSFISNLGCGLVSKAPLTHDEVEEEARKIAPKLLAALFDYAAKDFA